MPTTGQMARLEETLEKKKETATDGAKRGNKCSGERDIVRKSKADFIGK